MPLVKFRKDGKPGFRVITYPAFLYFFSWKTTQFFDTAEETRAFLKELNKTDKTKLELENGVMEKLYNW